MAEFIKRFYEKKIRHIMGGPSLSRFFLGADRGERAWYVNMSVCQYVNMSICQYVSMSVCQYVNMSICQYVRMQLFSLVIKMKVVQNVKMISENIISV